MLSGRIREPPEREEADESSAVGGHSSTGAGGASEITGNVEQPTGDGHATKKFIRKDLYIERGYVQSRSLDEVEAWRRENNKVEVKAFDKTEKYDAPNPCLTFEEAFWSFEPIVQKFREQKFEKPSAIQSQLWPVVSDFHILQFIIALMLETESKLNPAIQQIQESSVRPRLHRNFPDGFGEDARVFRSIGGSRRLWRKFERKRRATRGRRRPRPRKSRRTDPARQY